MRNLHRVVCAIAALTAALLIIPLTNGSANAAPPAPYLSAAFAPGGTSVSASLRDGVFRPNAANTELQVVDRGGRVLDALPLVGEINGVQVPVRYTLGGGGSSVTITPELTEQRRTDILAVATDVAEKKPAKPAPKPKRLTKQQRYDIMMKELQKGWKDFTPISTLIGGLIGFIVFGWIGAAVGAAIGAYVGYQTTNPKAWPAVVAWWNTP
ncbi:MULTISPECIES: hypothetical protein [unclassified Gordonia (in: high G+C Gram-positive bacteria)]